MLNAKGLTFGYNKENLLRFPEISCKDKESCLILGNSGCGKTTLLHILGGLIRPLTGNVIIDGVDITTLSNATLDNFRGKNIGIIFQKPHFIQSLNVLDNIVLAQQLAGLSIDRKEIERHLDQLGLSAYQYAHPSDLSQGEQQRLSIIRALINHPKLILADEPTSALDDSNCEEVITLLKEQANSLNSNLIVVTHDARVKAEFQNQIKIEKYESYQA
ncbi:MAG: ATP-binding cassette domain-containing protein [Saprospiraceae bacterium]|nr:ATP-binding cassette domain-containing protein [Saprospiraceae bacterium]